MANPKLEVLTPCNCQVICSDQQPKMAFGVQSIDHQALKNNVVGLAKTARIFSIPPIITNTETASIAGHTYLLGVFPGYADFRTFVDELSGRPEVA